jgi:hypothetical protein
VEGVGEWLSILGTEWVDGQPFLLSQTGDAPDVVELPVAGFQFSYRARPDLARVCVGHRLATGDQVCSRPVEPGSRVCRSCAIQAALFASDLHHAHTREPSGVLTDHLNQPNVLYLAVFGDGSTKIGTSVAHRVETRLIEQGVRLARILGRTADGVTVRVLEDLVTQTLSIAQTVSVIRKLRGLTDPRSETELASRVEEQAARVHELLAGVEGWERFDHPWSNPVVGDKNWDVVFPYPRDLGVGSHNVVAAGACGRIVLLSRPEEDADRFVADLKQLYGIRLEQGSYQTPAITAQHTLF